MVYIRFFKTIYFEIQSNLQNIIIIIIIIISFMFGFSCFTSFILIEICNAIIQCFIDDISIKIPFGVTFLIAVIIFIGSLIYIALLTAFNPD